MCPFLGPSKLPAKSWCGNEQKKSWNSTIFMFWKCDWSCQRNRKFSAYEFTSTSCHWNTTILTCHHKLRWTLLLHFLPFWKNEARRCTCWWCDLESVQYKLNYRVNSQPFTKTKPVSNSVSDISPNNTHYSECSSREETSLGWKQHLPPLQCCQDSFILFMDKTLYDEHCILSSGSTFTPSPSLICYNSFTPSLPLRLPVSSPVAGWPAVPPAVE